MNTKQFIKVTKGGKSFVVTAQNKSYYLSQGATITEPTKEEILVAFPELANKPKQDNAARIGELEKAVADRDKTIADLQAQIEQLTKPTNAAEVPTKKSRKK